MFQPGSGPFITTSRPSGKTSHLWGLIATGIETPPVDSKCPAGPRSYELVMRPCSLPHRPPAQPGQPPHAVS